MPTLPDPTSSKSTPRAMMTDISLASAAGYADAASYLLAGSFTGHLTGNTVLSAIALGEGDRQKLILPVLAVALFLCGTATGLSMGRLVNRSIDPLILALPLEVVLVACASMSAIGHIGNTRMIIVACLCLALGIQNGVFRKTDGVTIHATYITGDVTSLLAGIIPTRSTKTPGNPAPLDHPEKGTAVRVLGFTWLSFSAGALLSVLMIHRFGPHALWLLEIPIALAAFSSWKSSPGSHRSSC